MKKIDTKSLIEAGRSGKSDMTVIRKQLFSTPTQKKLDDREPEERMADEFEKLSVAIQSMNKAQSEQFVALLQSLITSIKRIEIISNKPQDKSPVKVEVIEKKKEWIVEVDATRNEKGLIEYPYNIKIKSV